MKLSRHVKKYMEEYSVDPEDVAFCELRSDGWPEIEAAYYAYKLTYSDSVAIKRFMNAHTTKRPGISQMLTDMNAAKNKSVQKRRTEEEFERRVEEAVSEKMKELMAMSTTTDADDMDKMSKEELGRMYIGIMRDQTADYKSKMDASKAYSALYQLQKEQDEEEDNRINFYLPVNCHYCDRCRECQLKSELEARGCKIRAKKTSPYLWQIVKPSDDPSDFIDESLSNPSKDQSASNE